MKQLVVLILILGFCVIAEEAANAQKQISEESYLELQEQVDYTKTKEIWVPRDFGKKKKAKAKKIEPHDFNGIDTIMSIIGYILLGFIVIGILFIVWRDLIKDRSGKVLDIELDNIEDIEAVDFDGLFERAINNKDYRLALRIKFLTILKSLTKNKKLIWKPYKTNRAYVNELKRQSYKVEFRGLANIFEDTWYGMSDVSFTDYCSFSPQFDDFLNLIENEE